MSSLLSWEAPLVDLLDQFHSKTSPLDTNFQSAVHAFKNITGALLGTRSGPEAFQGEAALALEEAASVCLAHDNALINAQILAQSTKVSTDFALMINEATGQAASSITDETILAEVLASMSVFQAAQYGANAVPQGIAFAIASRLSQLSSSPSGESAAMSAENTLHALTVMADSIQSAERTWAQGHEANVSDHASVLNMVDELWSIAQSLFDILKTFVHNKRFKSFGEFLDKGKGGPLAAFSFLVSMLANPPHTLNQFMTELGGSVLSFGAVSVPGIGEAIMILDAIHFLGPLSASGQDAFAVAMSRIENNPQLRPELQNMVNGMMAGAGKVDAGSVFNDVASLYYTYSLFTSGTLSPQEMLNMVQDARNLRHDTWNVIDGTWQFSTNLLGAGLDDSVALIPGVNDPAVSNIIIRGINTTTHWVASLPDKFEHWLGVLGL